MKVKYTFKVWFIDFTRIIEFPSLEEAHYFLTNTKNITWWEELE